MPQDPATKRPLGPYESAFAITPGEPFAVIPEAVHVGGAGDMAVTFRDGSTVVLKGLAAGQLVRIRPISVEATGTTAADIVGLF
jgi:hypothetical protein